MTTKECRDPVWHLGCKTWAGAVTGRLESGVPAAWLGFPPHSSTSSHFTRTHGLCGPSSKSEKGTDGHVTAPGSSSRTDGGKPAACTSCSHVPGPCCLRQKTIRDLEDFSPLVVIKIGQGLLERREKSVFAKHMKSFVHLFERHFQRTGSNKSTAHRFL